MAVPSGMATRPRAKSTSKEPATKATPAEAAAPRAATKPAATKAATKTTKSAKSGATKSAKSAATKTTKTAKTTKAATRAAATKTAAAKARARRAKAALPAITGEDAIVGPSDIIRVRRMHRRDINRVWEFLKRVFRDVNQKTVEYQRPRSKMRFEESYDDEGIEQHIFEIGTDIVGYSESTFATTGSDNWINWRWFDSRDMRPLFVEELAVHPDYQGRGVGGFMIEQLQHLARLRGCTHLVLEVAENNSAALTFYRKRHFQKIDAAIFLAQKIENEPELLPPRPIKHKTG